MENDMKTPLWDTELTEEERIYYLLSEMTIEEKLQCMGTGCPAISRLGLPAFHLGGEAAHGVQARHDQGWDLREPDLTTIFPNPIGMSATWDTELIKQAGRVTGTEARGLFNRDQNQKGGLSLWAPTIDMERDPRWGRTEEGYGEDPVLTGAMAGAYVEGLQGDDPEHLLAAATVKHFYANNVEEGRCWKSSAIDARNREEYYLEPFRRVIQEHRAEGLMTAYNEINGIPCMLNTEVRTIAKEQWGLHHVVCDGGDVSQTVDFHHYFTDHADTIAAGLKAGIDCFTDREDLVLEAATKAYQQGMITEEEIDEALYHHFGVMLRLGFFDPPETNPYARIGMESVGTAKHHRIARQVAAEAVVLLQNEAVYQGVDRRRGPLLPLSSETTVVAIGPQANVWYKDWYSGIPPYHVTPAEGLYDALGDRMKVVCDGIENVRIRVDGTKDYFGIDAVDGTIRAVSYEAAEVFQIEYWGDGRTTLRACSNGKLMRTEDARDHNQTGLITASSDEAFGWFVKEIYQLSLSGEPYNGVNTEKKRQAGMKEQREGDVVFSRSSETEGSVLEIRSWNGTEIDFDQQGRLCVPMEASVEEMPEEGVAGYDRKAAEEEKRHDTLRIQLEIVQDGIAEAAKAATKAEIAILYLGPNPMINCKEEIDRTHLNLPPYQQRLMEAVYAANPNTVLVLVSSIPFGIGWAKEHIPAILNTASGGMELGHGIADVLTGAVSPAARLPLTWYVSADDLPPMDDYDIIQGERTYQYFPGKVLYPFGHGLTYSTLEYEDLEVTMWQNGKQIAEEGMGLEYSICDYSERSLTGARQCGTLCVTVKLRNVAARVTDEVVQIYGRKVGSVVKRPLKTLLAFKREKQIVMDEERIIVFEVPLLDLCYYSEELGRKVLESGEYEIMAGASSEKIHLRKRITICV